MKQREMSEITSQGVFLEFLKDLKAAADTEWQKDQEDRKRRGRPPAPERLNPAAFISGVMFRIECEAMLKRTLNPDWKTFAELLLDGWNNCRS